MSGQAGSALVPGRLWCKDEVAETPGPDEGGVGMNIWLIILIIVLVVLAVGGGWGITRRRR